MSCCIQGSPPTSPCCLCWMGPLESPSTQRKLGLPTISSTFPFQRGCHHEECVLQTNNLMQVQKDKFNQTSQCFRALPVFILDSF